MMTEEQSKPAPSADAKKIQVIQTKLGATFKIFSVEELLAFSAFPVIERVVPDATVSDVLETIQDPRKRCFPPVLA